MIFVAPIISLLSIYFLFIYFLKKNFKIDFFAEIGTLYMGLFLAYSIIPALTFIFTKLNSNDSLVRLLPNDSDLARHLWRHVVFALFFSVGYWLFRGKQNLPEVEHFKQIKFTKSVLYFILGTTIFCIIYLKLLSSPVETYYDSFTRYDHLPWVLKKFASLLIRFKYGFYSITLAILFLNFKKYRIFTLCFLLLICIYEISDSLGARIIALMILLQASCLFSLSVAKLSIKKGLIFMFALALLFTVIEIGREVGFNLGEAKSNVNSDGFRTATEFASVFYPGYHLYEERRQSALPPRPLPMFFSDIISIFTFGDFDKWTPMSWYNKYYYPDVDVSPYTIGPIAESAMWGGEIDLAIRAFINGIFFAFIVCWFIKRSTKWWAFVIYTYCYSTCILTMKYSVFFQLTPIVKTVLPTLLITGLFIYMIKKPKVTVAISTGIQSDKLIIDN